MEIVCVYVCDHKHYNLELDFQLFDGVWCLCFHGSRAFFTLVMPPYLFVILQIERRVLAKGVL